MVTSVCGPEAATFRWAGLGWHHGVQNESPACYGYGLILVPTHMHANEPFMESARVHHVALSVGLWYLHALKSPVLAA